MTRTETHDCSLCVLGEDVCKTATVVYEYSKGQRASHDIYGWEPHIDPHVTLESITVQIGGKEVDLLPLFPAKHRARMEADLLRAVQEEQELM